MITLVAKVLNLIATAIQSILFIASFTGKIIVITAANIVNFIAKVFENITIFLQILYEDNISNVTEDLPNFVNNVLDTGINHWCNIYNGSKSLAQNVIDSATTVLNLMKGSTNAIIVLIYEFIINLKRTIIFIGDTLWLLLTFIPIQLPNILSVLVIYLKDCLVRSVVDTYMALLKFTNFLTDVPLQSLMGIACMIITIRLCVHYRESINFQIIGAYWWLIRNILYLYHTVCLYFSGTDLAIMRYVSGGRIERRDSTDTAPRELDEFENAMDTLCVICQERQKSVLTLPCRHVCLCTECCITLYNYQRTCPMCRTFIYHSVTIYL